MRPSLKLDSKWFGPFKVVRRISPYAYELELPASIRIHRVQPVSLLHPVVSESLDGKQVNPPPLVEVDGGEAHQVWAAEDSRMYRSQLQYLMRWTGYDSLTSEPAKIVDGLQAVDEFHQCYPTKPGPLESVL